MNPLKVRVHYEYSHPKINVFSGFYSRDIFHWVDSIYKGLNGHECCLVHSDGQIFWVESQYVKVEPYQLEEATMDLKES